MNKKDRCHECGGSTIECVSAKDPDIITVACFKCGVIARAYHKDNPDEDIEIKEE